MKKVFSFLLVVILAFGTLSALAGCSKRENELWLYSQGEYMDETIFKEFEAEYKEKTGKKIKLIMKDFQSNEDMYSELTQDKATYDLICPSDYMIEKMIRTDMVKKVNKSVINVSGLVQDEYLEIAKIVDPNLDYIVPYMYGTYGIMYNYAKTGEHITSWDALFTDKYKGKITTKKSAREVYTSSQIYGLKDQLAKVEKNTPAYKTAIQEIFDNTSDERIALAKDTMTAQKGLLRKYDEEDGKFLIGNNDLHAGLFWSCDAGYVMNSYDDDNGDKVKGNTDLYYTVPDEGGNVYIDGFVIGAYSVNEVAANMFLEFISRKEIAIRNSISAGAISTIKSAYDQLYDDYHGMTTTDEDSDFYELSEEWRTMYLEMLFPSAQTLNRCGVMSDYKDKEDRILQMITDIVV